MDFSSRFYKLKNILELSLALARAEFKLRNEGSYLGVLWYLLYPLALFGVILFVGPLAFAQIKIAYYPLYLILGIVMANFFIQTLYGSIHVVQNNSGLIKSVKINYESLVISKVIQSVFSHAFEVVVIFALMVYYGIPLMGVVWYALIFCFFVTFILGASFIFASLGAYINDLGNVWMVAGQLLFFITPTFYVVEKSQVHYAVNMFNPLFYFLTVTREVVIYQRVPEAWLMAAALIFSITSLMVGVFRFEQFKNKFAELV